MRGTKLTLINMTRASLPSGMPWSLGEDAGPPAPRHWCFPRSNACHDSHRAESPVGAAPASGLAGKHGTQFLLTQDAYSSPVDYAETHM